MGMGHEEAFREVDPEEAARLVRDGAVRLLDVRSPAEYAGGHIPGAALLPVDLIASAPATLEPEGKPWLVYCEHGVRSLHAARILVQAGFPDVINMSGGMSAWRGPREHTAADPAAMPGPASWLLQNSDLLPWGGKALDVACGAGRNALLLAGAGLSVTAVDRDAGVIARLAQVARRLQLPLQAHASDLEMAGADLGEGAYDLVLVIHYLHRPLFPALVRALRPGGLLLYETFTTAQAARGRPTNPDYLLRPGELAQRVSGLEIVRQREGEFEGRMVAGVAALRPAAGAPSASA